MNSINNILSSIINGKPISCCLCFKTIEKEPVYIQDEVVYLNKFEENVPVSKLLFCVLGEKALDSISSFGTLCEHCIMSLVNSYTFSKTSLNNISFLCNSLEGLITSLENTTEDYDDCKTLFISLDPGNCTSNQYYDNFIMKNNSKAIKQFNSIINIKQTENSRMKKHNISRKFAASISTADMLLDNNEMDNIKCKECHKKFTSIWNLRNHYIRVHAPKDYKCTECHRSYGSQCYLTAHKLDSHCSIVCRECGKTFYNRNSLYTHEQSHNLRIVCPDCGRIYKSRNTYKKHIELNVCGQRTRASPSEAKFTCDYCNKRYTQKVSLRIHIQFEHGNFKGHECKWCNKKFWAKSRLNAHIVKHTKEKKFKCDICNNNFVTKESLLYHTRIHTGEKPYQCAQCDAKFVSASRRLEHVKRYHSDLNLECDICLKKYKNVSYFLRHKKAHCENKKDKMDYVVYVKDDRIEKHNNLLNHDMIQELNVETDSKQNVANFSHFNLLKDNVCILKVKDELV